MRPASISLLLVATALASSLAPLWSGTSPGRAGLRAGGGQKHTVRSRSEVQAERVEIEPADTVVWVNKDDRDHTVVATTGALNRPDPQRQELREKVRQAGKYNTATTYTRGCGAWSSSATRSNASSARGHRRRRRIDAGLSGYDSPIMHTQTAIAARIISNPTSR